MADIELTEEQLMAAKRILDERERANERVVYAAEMMCVNGGKDLSPRLGLARLTRYGLKWNLRGDEEVTDYMDEEFVDSDDRGWPCIFSTFEAATAYLRKCVAGEPGRRENSVTYCKEQLSKAEAEAAKTRQLVPVWLAEIDAMTDPAKGAKADG